MNSILETDHTSVQLANFDRCLLRPVGWEKIERPVSAYPPSWRRGWWRAAASGFVLLLVAGIIIHIKTRKGEVTIQSDAPKLQVTISEDGERVNIEVVDGEAAPKTAGPQRAPTEKQPSAPPKRPTPGSGPKPPTTGPKPIKPTPPITYQVDVPQADRVQVPLVAPVADGAMGGGGRYLILRLAGKKKLAVFDVQQGKVTRELPLREEVVYFAAGANRLAVVNPDSKTVELWSLDRFELQRTAVLPSALTTGPIRQVCMGSASNGPLFFYLPNENRTWALNLDTLDTTEVTWSHWGSSNAYGPLSMCASPDGSLLIGWGGGWAGSEAATFREGVQTGANHQLGPFWAYDGAYALPSADARFITIPEGIVNRGFSLIKAPAGSGYLLPSVEPGYFLSFASGPPHRQTSGEAAVYTDERKLLFHLKGLDELKTGSDLPLDKRVYYYPRAGLLVTLGAEKDRLLLRRVDLAEQLQKSGADYLVVLSRPPKAKAGTKFTYRLDIRSRKGGVNVKLESGPSGMKATPDGEVSWTIPASPTEPEAEVLVSIRDRSGQVTLHTFTITIAPP
jgi:hypothetical protein